MRNLLNDLYDTVLKFVILAIWIAVVLFIVAILSGLFRSGEANADSFTVTNCWEIGNATSCSQAEVLLYAPDAKVIHVKPKTDPAAEERIRKWEAFCQPRPVPDRYGVDRLQYAHIGCEYGRTE